MITSLFPVTVEGKAAYIDAKGKVRLRTQLAFAQRFSEGLAPCGNWDQQQTDPVTKWWRGQYGFINPEGELVIPLDYDEAHEFHDGLARVRVGKHWGYINTRGEVVVEPRYEHAEDASEGLALVRGKKQWHVLDTGGDVVFTTDASKLAPCHDGLLRCEKKRKWSYLDRTGRPAFELTCTAAEDFSEGLAAVLKDRRIGYIDPRGEWVIPPRFVQASRFREGFARVEFAADDPAAPQDFGFIDNTGDRSPPGSFDGAGLFSEGLAAVTTDRSAGWSYIDPRGRTKIRLLACASAGEFQDGLAVVQVDDPKTGERYYTYIDTKGKTVWKQH